MKEVTRRKGRIKTEHKPLGGCLHYTFTADTGDELPAVGDEEFVFKPIGVLATEEGGGGVGHGEKREEEDGSGQ